MSSNNNEGRSRGRGISTRLTNDKPFQSSSTRTTDNWMSNKRIDRHYRINGGKTKLIIKQGDITNTKVDAIVNAANEHMTGGAGVDGMIHRAAGPQLRDECYLHRQVEPGVRLPTGRSRILLSYNLASNTSYIINTAGPIYDSYDKQRCEKDLESCYKTALALANLYDLKSIAFPAISCGIFGYPVDKGAETALKISDQHADQLSEVMFILFDDHIYDTWYKKATELGYSLWDPPQKSIVKPETEDIQTNDDNDDDVVTHSTGQSASVKPNPSAKTRFDPEVVEAPSPPSDTQQTQDMQDSEEDKPKETTLVKQSTAEMTDVQSQIDKTEDKDKSQSQSSSSPAEATGEKSADPAAAATAAETGTENN